MVSPNPRGTAWYYVQKPESGVCVRQRLTASNKIKGENMGWIISTENICGTKVPVETYGVSFIPDPNPVKITSSLENLPSGRNLNDLSGSDISIINAVDEGEIIVPDWFYNNIRWRIGGSISSVEFKQAYDTLISKGQAYPRPTEIEFLPEASAEEEDPSILQSDDQPEHINCPARVNIIDINTNQPVADNFYASCEIIKKYTDDPRYRVVYLENGYVAPLPEEEPPITATPDVLTWYYVKKPSGICERLNVSQKFVNQMTSQGWIFSLTDICEPEPIQKEVYTQSANVGISFTSNIGGFSTSIPINDVGQLQILSNESNEWKYTLIGSSTNQPLMTLNGLINKINNLLIYIPTVITPESPVEEPPVTTDHIPPPDMPVEEPPMVTVTPTEPGQVNWIPEPFFSFINNVFRR